MIRGSAFVHVEVRRVEGGRAWIRVVVSAALTSDTQPHGTERHWPSNDSMTEGCSSQTDRLNGSDEAPRRHRSPADFV